MFTKNRSRDWLSHVPAGPSPEPGTAGLLCARCASPMEPIGYLPPGGRLTALVLYRCRRCGRREWVEEAHSASSACLETCRDLPSRTQAAGSLWLRNKTWDCDGLGSALDPPAWAGGPSVSRERDPPSRPRLRGEIRVHRCVIRRDPFEALDQLHPTGERKVFCR